MPADPVGHAIEIGMAGNDADGVPGGPGQESADGGVGAQGLQGTENGGMMGKDEIVSTPGRLFDEGTGGVQGKKDTVDRLLRVTHEKTDIVPVFRQVFRGYLVEDFENFLNGRHSFALNKEKEAHP